MSRPIVASHRAPRLARPCKRGRRVDLLCWACLFLCGALLISTPAEAQRRRRPWFDFGNLHGEVAVRIDYDKEIRETTGQTTVKREELLTQEEFNIGGSGWIYHPALLDIDARVGVLFNQNFVSNNRAQSTKTFDNVLGYDVRLGVFPYKPYPISLFASQLRSHNNSPFSPQRVVDTFRYGAGLTLQQLALGDWEIPTRMIYRHQETDTASFAGQSATFRDRDEAEFVMDNKTDRTRNNLRYNWKALSSENRGTKTSSSRHNIRLLQDTYFDRGDLSSQLFAVKSTGSFDTLSLSLNEDLGLSHDHSFSSSYGYAFSYQDTGGISQTFHSGVVGFSHQLYESLSSSAQINVSSSESNFGTTKTGGLGGQLNYNKKIPGGSFGLRFAPSYLYTEDDVEPGIIPIDDERHSVQVVSPISLDHSLVLTETIEVTNPLNGDIFDRDIDCLDPFTDYYLVQLGIHTAIQVCVGSDLALIERTLNPKMAVSYEYRLEPARTFSTLSLLSGFSLDLWDHFLGDLSYATVRQTLLDGSAEQSTLDDSRRLIGRVEVNFDHSRTRLEYERLRSSINPRERFSATQNFSFRPGSRTSLGIAAGYDHEQIMDPDRLTQAVSASANMTTVLPFEILARLNLLFRWVDQTEQRNLGAGPTLALTYRYGRLRFQLTDRLTWRRTEAKTGRSQTTKELINNVFFRVERPF